MHWATHDIAVSREDGCATQPDVGWLGELLLPGACQPGLSSDRSARESSAASVVVCEAQGAGWEGVTVLSRLPVPGLAFGKTGAAYTHFSVGESLTPCL